MKEFENHLLRSTTFRIWIWKLCLHHLRRYERWCKI